MTTEAELQYQINDGADPDSSASNAAGEVQRRDHPACGVSYQQYRHFEVTVPN